MNPGNLALKLSVVLAAVALVAAVRWARGRPASEKTFRLAYHGMTACLAFASAILMAAILLHDFRFEYVIGYSSRDLPGLYLVSAFWAGQEGTYLLWALMAAVIGYPLFRKRSWEPAAVMACYVPTIGFLLVLMLDPGGNPFRMAAQLPPDGRGLNPLLQDPWMASHPPLVFLGYAAAAVPAVLALVALFRRREEGWLTPALRWSLVAFIFLGAGIILGGFWAYKVLGWGGYWGWDPVENASLIPWLVVTALFHGLLVQRNIGALGRTNLVLALSGYLLVLYATFLTRSGVLAKFSVHSFPAGSIYRILVGIMLVVAAVSAYALLRRRAPAGKVIGMRIAWPLVFSVTIILLAISAAFVLIGTSWPIISTFIGKPSSPGPPFYNRVNLPLYVALLALLGLAPFLAWTRVPHREWLLRILPGLGVAVIGTTVAVAQGARGVGGLCLFFVALIALTSNVIRLAKVARRRMLNTGAALAHVGFALMFLGIVASSAWGVSERASLPLGRPVEVMDRILTYRGHVEGSSPQDRWRVVVQRPGEAETTTFVSMFRTPGYGDEEQVFRRPAILRGAASDLYVAPLALEYSGGGSGSVDLVKGQPVRHGDAALTFLGFDSQGMESGHEMSVWARIALRVGEEEETVTLPFGLSNGRFAAEPVEPAILPGVTLTLRRMSVEQGLVRVEVDDRNAAATEVLSVEVSTKPLIGILWAGTALLGLGCGVAAVRRYVDGRIPVAESRTPRKETARAGTPATERPGA